jgi:hypothetical protein
MNMSILVSLILLVQFETSTALPTWAEAFWSRARPQTAWHKIWNLLEATLLGPWTHWNNIVLNSQWSIWSGQILITALATMPIVA